MKNKIDKKNTILRWFFWLNIIVISGITLCMLQIKGPDLNSKTGNNTTYERYAIMLTLIAIPAALKIFSVLTEKSKNQPQAEFQKKYIRNYVLRSAILDITALINIIGFYKYESSNFVYLAVIVMFAICFTYPERVNNTIQEEKEEKQPEKNNKHDHSGRL